MSLLSNRIHQKADARRAELQKSLMHYEAKIGGQLFGPIPKGNRREFFCLDERTWVWHEEWTDSQSGRRQVMTTRYDMRSNGVLKSQGDNSYQKLTTTEAKNLLKAITMYGEIVTAELDRMIAAA